MTRGQVLEKDSDVVVVGGGPAGVAAAIASARLGASTQLIEMHGCLGGMWTAGLLCNIIDQDGKGGILAEILAGLQARGAIRGHVYDPEEMKLLLERMCLEAGVQVRLHTQVVKACVNNGRLESLVTLSKSGLELWQAGVFVDCSGDGDLCALAGCKFDLGQETSGETQPMSMVCLLAGYGRPDEPPFCLGSYREKVTWFRQEIERAGVCPSYANPSLFLIRPGLVAMMANHEYLVSGLDARQLTDATIRARRENHAIVDALRASGGRWADLRIVATPEQIGVREGRRICGRYTVTREDLECGKRHADAVCRPTFCVDVHSTNPALGKGLGTCGVNSQPYDIPLRALMARDVEGLLMAGRCISGSFLAHASYRVTGNAAALGQAAGVTAAQAARLRCLPREVPFDIIRPHIDAPVPDGAIVSCDPSLSAEASAQ